MELPVMPLVVVVVEEEEAAAAEVEVEAEVEVVVPLLLPMAAAEATAVEDSPARALPLATAARNGAGGKFSHFIDVDKDLANNYYSGSTGEYCGAGCQSGFGTC